MSADFDPVAHNRAAWDKRVADADEWTQEVSADVIARARAGDWSVVLIGHQPVDRSWFPDLENADVLCLASGGGQQGPTLAAAGARVTVFDNSPRQLGQDEKVAKRDGLELTTQLGDMRDLSVFADASFDLVFHPVSNVFAPDLDPVWRECFRVLRPGGTLLAGFLNPDVYIFDAEVLDRRGEFVVRHRLALLGPHAPVGGRAGPSVRGGRAGRIQPHADRADRWPARCRLRTQRVCRGAASCGSHGYLYVRLFCDEGNQAGTVESRTPTAGLMPAAEGRRQCAAQVTLVGFGFEPV